MSGDHIRISIISKHKNTFAKGNQRSWTEEILGIKKVKDEHRL